MKHFEKLKNLLNQAEEEGAEKRDLDEIKKHFFMSVGFSPTKKVFSKEKRRIVNNIQKKSRKNNWGKNKGIKCHNGIKFRMN